MRYDDLDPVQRRELDARAEAAFGWAKACDSRLTDDPEGAFRQMGYGRYLSMKGAVDPVLSTDPGVPFLPLTTAVSAQVDAESRLLDALFRAGAVRFPLDGAGRFQSGPIVATEVAETGMKPTSHVGFDLAGPVQKVAAVVAMSREADRALGQTLPRQIAVAALVDAIELVVVSALTAGPASGSSAVGDLLAVISGGRPSKPLVVGGYDTLAPLTDTLAGLRDLGIAVVATPAASGVVIVVDGPAVLLADDGVTVATMRHGNLTLDDGAGGGPTVSLWQSNLIAIRAERKLRVAIRAGAVAWAAGTP